MNGLADRADFAMHAGAKVNVALHVTGQRADGFHLIETLVMFTAAGDKVRIAINRDSQDISLNITGAFAKGLAANEDNLIVKAARALLAKAQMTTGLSITLTKNLPVASGIGGGSADAAVTLQILKRALKLPRQFNLHSIAATLGADVPMCLHSKSLIARNIGDEITLVDGLPHLAMLLVNPGTAISTPAVFSRLKQKDNAALAGLPSNPSGEVLIGWLKNQRNDLQAPAIAMSPSIETALEAIRSSGAELARMSGSGATCFGIFSDIKACQSARLQIAENHPDWWCISTHTQDYGDPVDVEN